MTAMKFAASVVMQRAGASIALALLLPCAARADEVLGVRCVTFSPDGQLLAAGTGEP